MKRDFLFLHCQDCHDWQLLGGRWAGCEAGDDRCACSLPVNVCRRCGDCDYGENDEAAEILQACKRRREEEGDGEALTWVQA